MEHSKIAANVIEKTNIDDEKNYLHNFYENILSHENIEDNFMHVLALLIKNEIMNLNNIVDTPCWLMTWELMQKSSIQNYLIKITKSSTEYLEKKNLKIK